MATLSDVVKQLQSQQENADQNAEKNTRSLGEVKGSILKLIESQKPTAQDRENAVEASKRARVASRVGGVVSDTQSGLMGGITSGLGLNGVGGMIGSILGGALKGVSTLLYGVGFAAATALKVGGLIFLAPIIGNLVSKLIETTLQNIDIPFFGNNAENKKAIADNIGSGVKWSIYGSLIAKLLGKRFGVIFAVGGWAYEYIGKKFDNAEDGSFLSELEKGADSWFGSGNGQTVIAGIGAAIAAGVANFMFKQVPKALSYLNPFAPKPNVPTPTIVPGAPTGGAPGRANTPPKVSKSVIRNFHRGGLAEGFSRSKSGALMRATGQGGKRVFASVDEVMNAMQLEKAAKYAKYAKALKFLGIIGTISAAALDPAIAMYEGKSDEEIKKQLAGALGGIGGAVIGGALGSVGTVWTGPGAILGGLVGAVGGGLLGEWGLEKLAEHLLSPDSQQSQAVSIGGYSDSSPVSMGGTYDTSGAFTPATVSRSESTTGLMPSTPQALNAPPPPASYYGGQSDGAKPSQFFNSVNNQQFESFYFGGGTSLDVYDATGLKLSWR